MKIDNAKLVQIMGDHQPPQCDGYILAEKMGATIIALHDELDALNTRTQEELQSLRDKLNGKVQP